MNTFFLKASRFSDDTKYDERRFINLLRSVSASRSKSRTIEEASTPEEADSMVSKEMAQIIETEMQRLTLEVA